MKRLLLLLVACDAGTPIPQAASPGHPPVAQASPDLAPSPEDAIVKVDGRAYAVVQVRDWRIECSNLGGTHWTFDVDGMGPQFLLHGGGHGIFGDTSLPTGTGPAPSGSGDASLYYVAEIQLVRPVDSVRDGGWCLGGLPRYQGSVLAVAPAPDLAVARARLATISSQGFHPALRIDRFEGTPRGAPRTLDPLEQ